MKILTTILLFAIISLECYSQELKKIIEKQKNSFAIEEYSVLKSDNSTKHGEYVRKTSKDKLIEKGFYNNNRKDSIWISFGSNGTDTVSIFHYKNGVPVGQWIMYDQKIGKIKYIFDYSVNNVIVYNWFDTPNVFRLFLDNEWVEDSIDSPPLIIGNANPLQTILQNLKYPKKAYKNGISGRVFVAFTVDKTGQMFDVKLKKGIDPELDAEAVRVIKLMDTEWFPAKKNGQSITIEYFLPINFMLQ